MHAKNQGPQEITDLIPPWARMENEPFHYDPAAAESDIAIAVLIVLACASVMGGSLASFFVPHLSRGKFLGVMGAAALLLALP